MRVFLDRNSPVYNTARNSVLDCTLLQINRCRGIPCRSVAIRYLLHSQFPLGKPKLCSNGHIRRDCGRHWRSSGWNHYCDISQRSVGILADSCFPEPGKRIYIRRSNDLG
jgi:hypothetical protein